MSHYSTDIDGINEASFRLILDNAEHLIRYIYEHANSRPYDDAEISVGLAIKILIKSNETYSSELLQPIVDDLEDLINDNEYLDNFDDPISKKEALCKQLSLINKFMELDETISLNTLYYLPVKGVL